MSVEEHSAAVTVRPPLTRGESLPAVSLAQTFSVTAERNFKQEKLRTGLFDAAASFKPNGEIRNYSEIGQSFKRESEECLRLVGYASGSMGGRRICDVMFIFVCVIVYTSRVESARGRNCTENKTSCVCGELTDSFCR